ncbi:hypothetical protein J6590_068425 [Homalodisca vitripennis]|nr:hypothetical protein J6590_068425 [Homalodisca vitripennis]
MAEARFDQPLSVQFAYVITSLEKMNTQLMKRIEALRDAARAPNSNQLEQRGRNLSYRAISPRFTYRKL